jgi:hypothetical protein
MAAAAVLAAAIALALGGPQGPAAPAPAATFARSVFPAGSPVGESEAPAGADGGVGENADVPARQLSYVKRAAALPVVDGGRAWRNLGPSGQDLPPGSPMAPLRIQRSAGMDTAVAIDPRDPSGNSLYAGSLGGLRYTSDAGASWRFLGDGSLARAAVGAIAVDPFHPQTVYVGTGNALLTSSGDAPGAGVYVSRDGGLHFERPAQNVAGYAVTVITVLSSGVLVGTSNGLYDSADGGRSFHRVALPTNAQHTAPATGVFANWITSITAVRPTSPSVLVAVGYPGGKRMWPDGSYATPDHKPAAPGNGIYRSTMGAAGPFHWLPGSTQLSNAGSTTDPLGVIVMSYGVSGEHPVLWALVSDAGRFTRRQRAGLDAITNLTGQDLDVTSTTLNGLYRSDDDGASWTLKATPESLQASVNDGLGFEVTQHYGVGAQAGYNTWVKADPVIPDRVYIGLEEVFQSTAGTQSGPGLADFDVIEKYWDTCGDITMTFLPAAAQPSCPDGTPYGGVATHPDQHTVAIARTKSGMRMYTGNDGGLFREDAHALPDGRVGYDNAGWKPMNSIATVEAWKVARKTDGEYLSALQDNGSGFFKPGAAQSTVYFADGTNTMATSDPDTWYGSAQNGVLYVTTDHGRSYRYISPDFAGATFLSPAALDPTDENHLVEAGNEIVESVKGSKTTVQRDPVSGTMLTSDWTSTFTEGESPTTFHGAKLLWNTAALAVRGSTVYAGICASCSSTLFDPRDVVHSAVATNVRAGCTRAKASSACWHIAAGKGLPSMGLSSIEVDPRTPRTVYVTTSEVVPVGWGTDKEGAARVLVSHDAGENFTDITGGLPPSGVHDIVLRDGKLIVGTDNGVFVGTPDGKHWSRLGGRLPQVPVMDLSLDPSGEYLTISVYGRGVWELDFGQAARWSSAGAGADGATVHAPPLFAGPCKGLSVAVCP